MQKKINRRDFLKLLRVAAPAVIVATATGVDSLPESTNYTPKIGMDALNNPYIYGNMAIGYNALRNISSGCGHAVYPVANE